MIVDNATAHTACDSYSLIKDTWATVEVLAVIHKLVAQLLSALLVPENHFARFAFRLNLCTVSAT